MVLDGMEPGITQLASEIRRRDQVNPKINLIRYADDFIVTGRNREILESEVKPLIEEFLAARGLHLSEEKTLVTHIDIGFEFLGWNVRKYKGTLPVKPAKKMVHIFLEEIRAVIKGHKAVSQEALIGMPDPKIRGWAQSHCRVNAKKTFSWVNH